MKGEMLDADALVMHPDDDVATALDDLAAGRTFDGAETAELGESGTVTLAEDVEFGHKFALRKLAAGEEIRKYGEVIGRATEPVAAGDWVHTHNCESTRGRGDLAAAGGEHA